MIRGGGEGERRGSDFSRLVSGDMELLTLAELELLDVDSVAFMGVSSSTVVERASLEVFLFKRTGDNDRDADGDAGPSPLVSSPISNFDKTFLRGGIDAGLGFAKGLSGSSPVTPIP